MNKSRIIGSALALSVFAAGPLLAQQTAQPQDKASGTTSGPAAGTNVEPSAASQRKAGVKDAGAVSAGAPGARAEKGSESGEKPKR
jgi:hypothetical protein